MAIRFTRALLATAFCILASYSAAADQACRVRQCDMPMTQSGAASQKVLCTCYKNKCNDEPDECKQCAIMILGVCSDTPCGGPNQPVCPGK